jgi:hypothetical protein
MTTKAATVRVTIEKPTSSGRREGWWKRVSSINREKNGGWAIDGTFLNNGEQDIPIGAVLVCMDPRGSARHSWKGVSVHLVTPEGLELIKGNGCDEHGDFNLRTQCPSLLDCIELAMDLRRPDEDDSPLAAFTNQELLAELARRGVQVSVG